MSSGDRIRRRGAQSQSINAGSDGSNVVTEGTGTPEAGQTVRTGTATRLGENTTGAARTLTTATNQAGATNTTAHSSVASFQNGVVTTTAGSRFDMTTARGVIQAQAELGANFTALQGTLEAQGFRLDTASGSWVPADAVDRGANPNKFTGALTAELRDADQEVINAMAERDFPNMVNKETAAATFAKLTGAQYRAQFNEAVDLVRAAITNTNAATVGRAADYINQLSTQIGANAMEILFFVFRESIQATNEDKKYFLERLQDYNLMAEKLSDYPSQIFDDSQRLSSAADGAKYPEKVTISIEVQKFDLSALDKDGKVATMAGYPMSKTVDRAGLNDTIKDVESMQETVRNKRQMASTAFQNFDQKANQLYNLMASVLKVMNEMRSSTTRNML
jgi:hypothetical protein